MQNDLSDTKTSEILNSLLGKLVQEINLKMGSGWVFEQLLDSIFEPLNVLIPYDRIGVAVVVDRGERLRLAWVKSKVKVNSLRKNYSAPLAGSSLETVLESGKPRIINDLEVYLKDHPTSQSTRLILKDGIRSSLTYPLKSNGQSIGVVFFSSCSPNTYRNFHLETFSAIADEISVIIEVANLRNYFVDIESRENIFSKVLHDLRSPLNVIQGYLDLVVTEDWYDELPSACQDVCKILQRNTENMIVLLNEFSELKRSEDPITHLQFERVNFLEFLNEVIASYRILASTKDISLKSSISDSIQEVVIFDPFRIRRVLDNLFSNAIKYSFRNTAITFTAWQESERLWFSVSDQGQGIRQEDIHKLFTDYGKTRTLPSEGESSSGLGLSIAKAIVQLHGGEISVDSKLGVGSTFTFWIPDNIEILK